MSASTAVLPREDLEARPLADLHAFAREAGVPRYRLLRREQLLDALGGPPAAPPAPAAPPPEAAPAAASVVLVEEATEVGRELEDAFARLVGQLSSSAPAPARRELEEITASPATRLLVARDGEDAIVGTLTLVLFRIPTGTRAWIEDVVVDERARGRGVGQALTREALRLAVDNGARTVDLTSRPSRVAANQMYEKLGFRRRETSVFRFED